MTETPPTMVTEIAPSFSLLQDTFVTTSFVIEIGVETLITPALTIEQG